MLMADANPHTVAVVSSFCWRMCHSTVIHSVVVTSVQYLMSSDFRELKRSSGTGTGSQPGGSYEVSVSALL